jgi:molybdopterin-guanine dinucleotide biosynthesis protein A
MGRDKALIEIDGEPMAARVAAALREAGAREVVVVGGADELADLGLRLVPDESPGEGPLGGVLTALAAVPDDVVLVVSCDLVAPSAAAMAATVAALSAEADVAVPTSPEAPPQWLHTAWRRSAGPELRPRFADGERSIGRAVKAVGLRIAWVPALDPAALADADRPEELPQP